MRFLVNIGQYCILLTRVFRLPEKFAVFRTMVVREMMNIGVDSVGIVAIISVFMGAVIAIQTASNIDSAFIPLYTVGFACRQSVILEFSPTVIALILAGKVGSNIASEIGTMRVTEQIDALEIMGINSASYLILPKVVAALLISPFLISVSMFLGISGGWFAGDMAGVVPGSDFLYGVVWDFDEFSLVYAQIKTLVFAFILTTVPAYYGYFTSGGALEVGRSSTKAVVYSSIVILIFNYIITQMLLI